MRHLRHKLTIIAGFIALAMLFCLALATAGASTVRAQETGDSACRGCHGDNERTLTLPSGEELPLLVHLADFDASAHGLAPEASCTTCHDAKAYRYPHRELPVSITTLAEYEAAAAETCVDCHYGHEPFHADLPPEAVAPSCIDCHGSHDIAPFDQMLETMPANCLTCHTDQTTDWVHTLFAPREGFGIGEADYAGSVRCLGCHEDLYLGWQETHHALSIQNAVENPDAVIGEFALETPERPFELADVVYTIGGIRQQKYITHTVESGFFVLPSQWNRATEEWASYHPEDWDQADWRETCAGCHVTGLNTETWEFKEFGIGCESCHGPGLAHSKNPEEVKPFAEVDDQVCGACHSRGESPDGLPYPATYRPGDTLLDHFTFTTDPEHFWPDGSSRTHNQQYIDWHLGNPMALDPSVSCISCHTVHGPGEGPAQLTQPQNEVCLQCHNDKRKLIQHMPYHEVASQSYDFVCADCHMPKIATSAIEFDSRSHAFFQPNPQGSLDHGGVDVMPNSCNLCHSDYGEDPAWALQTIEYSGVLEAQASDGFGPGPTPTSPPPPTPLPSVGEPVEGAEVEAPVGLRAAVFSIIGVGVLLALLLIYGATRHYMRTRSQRNV